MRAILDSEAEALIALLEAVRPDRDFGVDEPVSLAAGWPAWDLETALGALPGIGRDEGDEADRPHTPAAVSDLRSRW